MKLGLLLLLLLPIVYSQSGCITNPSTSVDLRLGTIVSRTMSQPGGELRIDGVGTYQGRNINIRMTQTSTRAISDGNLTVAGFISVLSSEALTAAQWVNFHLEMIDDDNNPVELPVSYWSVFDLEGPADKKEAVRLRRDQVTDVFRNGLQQTTDGDYYVFRATSAGTVNNPTDPYNLTAAQKAASVGFSMTARSSFNFGYQNVNSPRSCFISASTDEVLEQTFCPVCSAYGYDDGVTDGNPNSCVDNETELDAGDSCYIKCKEGYTQSGLGDVTCPTNATDGQAPLVDITCTETDECVGVSCGNGRCEDQFNGFQCICEDGWGGEFCDESTTVKCSTFDYSDMVVDGVSNSCADGVTALTAGNACNIKCAPGYDQGGAGTVTCPADATNGQVPIVDMECTPAVVDPCAAVTDMSDPCACVEGCGFSSGNGSCQAGSETHCYECKTLDGCMPGECGESCTADYNPMTTCQCTPDCKEYENCCPECLDPCAAVTDMSDPCACVEGCGLVLVMDLVKLAVKLIATNVQLGWMHAR
eukprot:UN22906